MQDRRNFLTVSAGIFALSGCIGGGNNSENNDDGTEASNNRESYDPNNYYGLPKCDGSKPVQLIDVQGTDGIIRNMTTDDLIVAVNHGGGAEGQSNGDYCRGHLLEAAGQTAYETLGEVSPSERIRIRAIEDTESNRDTVCSFIGMNVEGGGDGCVDPETFRG